MEEDDLHFLQVQSEATRGPEVVPVIEQSHSNVIIILGSQTQSVDQLSNEILLRFPFIGGKAVEQAAAMLTETTLQWLQSS
jgi:hypothetical protein